jgi:hypothetical protein
MSSQKPRRASLLQYSEYLLLERMRKSRIPFLVVGGTAAYAYGLEVLPKDLDLVVEYQRETWERILLLADEVDPQPSGTGPLTREPKSFPAQLHVNLGRGVDVLSGLPQANFAELFSRKQEAVVKVEHLNDEMKVPVADMGDLVASWRSRGEPRDAEWILAAEMLDATPLLGSLSL